MLSTGEKSAVVNRLELMFWPRRKLLSGRMLLFGEVLWPFGQPAGRRYWVRRGGKYSTKVPEATPSQIAEHIRRWLVANT